VKVFPVGLDREQGSQYCLAWVRGHCTVFGIGSYGLEQHATFWCFVVQLLKDAKMAVNTLTAGVSFGVSSTLVMADVSYLYIVLL